MNSEKAVDNITIEKIVEIVEGDSFEQVQGKIVFPSKYIPNPIETYAANLGIEICKSSYDLPKSNKPSVCPIELGSTDPDQYYLRCPADQFPGLIDRFKKADQLPPNVIQLIREREVAVFTAVKPGDIGVDGKTHSYTYQPTSELATSLIKKIGVKE